MWYIWLLPVIVTIVKVLGSMTYYRFLREEQLVCIDKMQLNDIFTYASDCRLHSFWIDHILCSPALLPHISDVV